jgi:hypothetical protein
MSTTNVSLSYQSSLAIKLADVSQNQVVTRDGDGDSDGTKAGGRAGIIPEGGLMQSVMQTLSHLGLSPSNQVNGAANASAADGNGDTDGSASAMSQDVRQAMHSFMYSLFQTLAQMNEDRASSGKSESGASPFAPPATSQDTGAMAQAAYGNLPEKLSALATATQEPGTGSELKASFERLVSTIGAEFGATKDRNSLGGEGGSEERSKVSLQSFLKSLAEELSNRTGSTASLFDATGSLLNQAV